MQFEKISGHSIAMKTLSMFAYSPCAREEKNEKKGKILISHNKIDEVFMAWEKENLRQNVF
jgi:hypothetical protein